MGSTDRQRGSDTYMTPEFSWIPREAGAELSLYQDSDSKAKVARQPSLITHLAQTTRESVRTRGLTFAAHEIVTMESFLRAFRGHLLTTPIEVRGDSYNMGLAMIESMIVREAMSKASL